MAYRRVLLLFGTGLVSEAAYLGLTLRLPWWRYGGGLQSWSQLLCHNDACPTGRWGALASCLAGLGTLMAAYLWGWHLIHAGRADEEQKVRRVRTITWAFAILFSSTLFWLMPITSDLFSYVGHAHLFADQGRNPMLAAALDLTAPNTVRDPLVSAYPTAYAASPAIYGPAWVLFSLPGTLGSHDVAGGLLYLKGLAVVAFLACAWLLERVLVKAGPASSRGACPGEVVEKLYLFAWNPLILLMAVGDGHNDMVMMAMALMAIWFLISEAWTLGMAALLLSAWIKYVSVILLPLAMLYVWHHVSQKKHGRRWAPVLGGALVMVVVSVLVLRPFGSLTWVVEWVPTITQRFLHPSNWQGHGAGPSERVSGLSTGSMVAGLVLFAAVYVLLTRRFVLENRTLGGLMDIGFQVSLFAFLLGAARSQPWHLIWPATLAGLSPRRWAWPTVVVLSVVMLLCQLWVEWGAPGLRIWS